MTPYQQTKRRQLEKRLGRPDPRSVRQDMRECLWVALAGRQQATVRSDEHPAYRGSLVGQQAKIRHRVTSSRERRDKRNPLWEVNLLDMLIRHSSSNHKRETIAWSKRRQGSAERLVIFLVWRNYLKRRWENGQRQTAGMLKGVVDRVLTVTEILAERLFRRRIWLPPRWRLYYDRQVKTRALPVNRVHDLRYAY